MLYAWLSQCVVTDRIRMGFCYRGFTRHCCTNSLAVRYWSFKECFPVYSWSLRYAQLRRNHRPLHTFIPRGHSHEHRSAFSEAPRSVPRTTGLPRLASDSSGDNLTIPMPITMSAALFYPPSLSHGRYPVIVATQDRGRNRRAAQGADIDAQGRRLGPRDPDDHEGDDDKDELPAYDNVNGPPKYMDLQVQMVGAIPLGALPMQVEQPHSRRSGDSPGSTSEGHSSQTSNSSEQVESSISSSDSRTATAENPTSVPSELPPPFLASSASQSSPELNADQTNFPQNIMPC